MPSFLSKVFGRKKDEKGSSPVRGRGYDGASLLEGKFEVVSPASSPTIGDFPEDTPRSKRNQKDSGPSKLKPRPSRSSSPEPSNRKGDFPQLPLSLPQSREEAQVRAIGTDFERYSDAQFLSDATISDRRLTPLEALILVRICAQAIVARGLETLGLMHPYWHSASPETQHRLISLFLRSLNASSPLSSADTSSFSLFESEVNYTLSPHDVAAVFRWGLRHLELGPGGFGNEKTWYWTFAEVERKARYPPQTYSETLTPLIPAIHLELLDATLDLFSSLAAHSEKNSTSASKLTRAFGFWLLTAQRDRAGDDWAHFYDRWLSSARVLEHVFLARIRDESLRTRMPTRLMELVAQYPYVEGERMEDDIFLHLQLSTRQFEALLVRVESELSPQEHTHRHPLQLLKDALTAQVMNVDDNELVSFWERIKKSGNNESEVTPGGYPGISRIFTDDTLRYLSLVPGNHPWKKSTSPTFNLMEAQGSTIFRRLASSPGLSKSEGLNRSANGHTKYNSGPASPSSTGNSALSGDWFQFSSAGFTDASSSVLPLASTLFGQDVEKTNPPSRNKRLAKVRSRSPSGARKSYEGAVSPLPPVPPVPDLPQPYSQKPAFKSTPISLVKIDEAFIDFWVDALLDPVSSNWPKFVLCKLRPDLPDLRVNDQRVEYIIIEHSLRLITSPLPPSSTAPITVPPTSAEHNKLRRTVSPAKSIPSSPRSFSFERRRFLNFFSSSSLSSGGNNASHAIATTSRGKKQKETASSPPERDTSDFGEMMQEKNGKSSGVVKLRMPSPKARRSVDASRRTEDFRGSNVDVSEQVRGRSMGEKELKKLKQLERKRKEAEEKMSKEAEKKREAEEKKREAEEKKREVEEKKRKEAEEKKKDGSQRISSIAASAVTAAAVAVATVTTGGSQQATPREGAEDNRLVELQTEEAAAEQGLEEAAEEGGGEETTPIDSEVTNPEKQPSRAPEAIIESPQAQDTKNTAADHFFESGVVEESAIQPSAPREPEIRAVAEPIGEAKPVSESVAPEPVDVAIEELVSPQEEASAAKPVVVQAGPKPIAVEEHAMVEEAAASSPPSLEPQIAVVKSTQEPGAADAFEEPVEELAPKPVAAESAVTLAIPVSSPDAVELSPLVEESTEGAGAVTERPIAAEASLAVPKPVAAEEFLIIEGPIAFDPSDIDAQIEEMNAQSSDETCDSESTSEVESSSESVATEGRLPVDVEELSPIQETDESEPDLTEDSIEGIVVVEEPDVLEASVEESTVTPLVPAVAEATIPILVPETPVAEEKDVVVPVTEEEEEVAEAEAAPIKEEPIDEVVTITETLAKPAPSPVVELPSLAADELHTVEKSTATLEQPKLVDIEEEIEPPTQGVPSEPAVAVEVAPVVEEFTIAKGEALVEKAVPGVEEEHAVEGVVTEEDSAFQVPTEKGFVPSEPAQAAVSLDEHHTAEEPAAVEDTEAVVSEKLVAGGVSDEVNGSEAVPGDQPAFVEEIVETPAKGESTANQPAIAKSAPVEYVMFEGPEVIEEPPTQKQVDKSHAIEVIKESSVEGLPAPVAETPAFTQEDVMESIEAEESIVVDEPSIEDHATEPAKEPVSEASAAEGPSIIVEEPSAPSPAEAANPPDAFERTIPTVVPVPEATFAETPIPEDKVSLTQPADTLVIDEDAIDAAAAKLAELAATPATALVEEHEEAAISDEPSASIFDGKMAVSNGGAVHVPVSGLTNGNGLHAMITEKVSASAGEEGTKYEFTPA